MRVAVGMPARGEPAPGGLDLALARAGRHAELAVRAGARLVVIVVRGHRRTSCRPAAAKAPGRRARKDAAAATVGGMGREGGTRKSDGLEQALPKPVASSVQRRRRRRARQAGARAKAAPRGSAGLRGAAAVAARMVVVAQARQEPQAGRKPQAPQRSIRASRFPRALRPPRAWRSTPAPQPRRRRRPRGPPASRTLPQPLQRRERIDARVDQRQHALYSGEPTAP